jgi:hypothetical protein
VSPKRPGTQFGLGDDRSCIAAGLVDQHHVDALVGTGNDLRLSRYGYCQLPCTIKSGVAAHD